MLSALVFIFTSGSSVHVVVYRSDCRYLPYSIHSSSGFMPDTTRKSYENGRRKLLGLQSINTERTNFFNSSSYCYCYCYLDCCLSLQLQLSFVVVVVVVVVVVGCNSFLLSPLLLVVVVVVVVFVAVILLCSLLLSYSSFTS